MVGMGECSEGKGDHVLRGVQEGEVLALWETCDQRTKAVNLGDMLACPLELPATTTHQAWIALPLLSLPR